MTVTMPAIPLESYRFCLTSAENVSIIVQISLSLAFGKHFVIHLSPFLELICPPLPLDIAVFAFVIAQARLIKSMHPGVNVPAILKTLSRDAEIYFVVISSSHTSTVIMYPTARVGFFAQMLDFTPY